jgi:hypothetical protein
MKENDASRIVFGDIRVTLQIVVPLTDYSRGVMYDHNMFIVQATSLIFAGKAMSLPMRYAPLRQALALLSNLRLVLKDFPRTNTLAYFVSDKEKKVL